MTFTNPANLSPRQIEVAVELRRFRYVHGYSPTLRELARTLRISHVTVAEHLWVLGQKRVVKADKHKSRSLRVIRDEALQPMLKATKLEFCGEVA